MLIATLAHPGGLRSSLAEAAAAAAGAAEWRWLEEGRAADLIIAPGDIAAVRAALQPLEAEADVIVQPAADRARRLFVSDMDSTIIQVECIDELADYVGVKSQVAAITERAMQGELDFAGSLKARVALLTGLPVETIARCYGERVRATPGAATLLATLKAEGVRSVLVSGGFTAFTARVAAALGFDAHHANRLEDDGTRLTGRVAEPILGAEAKRHQLESEARAMGVRPSTALAVGDGANDAPMLRAAGLGLAYRAKPAAEAAADASIRHGDLTAVLWALGLPRSRWAEPA